MDLGVFKDRVLLNATFSSNKSANQLLLYALPSITGFDGIDLNFPATIRNTIWEFSLSTINFSSKKFSWSTNLNFSFPKNKVVSFPGIENTAYADGTAGIAIGHPIGVTKVYKFSGVNPETGLYQFLNHAGSDISDPNYPADLLELVSNSPKFYGGMQNSIVYGNFSLDFVVQFVKQQGIDIKFNGNISGMPGEYSAFSSGSNQPISVLSRWTNTGDRTNIQRYSASDFAAVVGMFYAASSDGIYSDASYLRVKNVSISYRFSQSWLHQAQMQSAKIFISGQNLLTFTHYKGLDPETQSSYGLPPLTMVTAGIQVNL